MIASTVAANVSTDARIESLNLSRKCRMIASRPPDDCKRLHLRRNGANHPPLLTKNLVSVANTKGR